MAWVLLGVGALAVCSYVASEISEFYDKTTKPIRDWFDERARESAINEKEDRRQQQIEASKERKVQTNKIISKYKIVRPTTTIINNYEELVDVIFVNSDRGGNPPQAIEWAERVLSANLLDRTNTKIVTLGAFHELQLIKQEMTEYIIVLHMKNKFVTLNQTDFDSLDIMTKNKFEVKSNPTTDINCSKWF